MEITAPQTIQTLFDELSNLDKSRLARGIAIVSVCKNGKVCVIRNGISRHDFEELLIKNTQTKGKKCSKK